MDDNDAAAARKKSPRRNTVGAKAGAMTADEEEKWAQRFEMFQFENRVREIVAEMQRPLNLTSRSILDEVQENREKWVELDAKLSKAARDLQRAQAGLLDFREVGPKMERLAQWQADMGQKVFSDHQHVTTQIRQLTGDVNRARRDVDEVAADVNAILRKGDALEAALKTMADHREKMQAYVDEVVEENDRRWAVKAAEQAQVTAQVEQQNATVQKFKDFMQATDVRVRGFEKDVEHLMDLSVEAVESLRGVETWDKRIAAVEEDMRQVRKITEQHVVDVEKRLRNVVQQKTLETTILHYMWDLVEHGLFNLQEPDGQPGLDFGGPTDSKARNHRLSDQLRLDLRAWQARLLAKYEQPRTWDSRDAGEVGIFAGKELPSCSAVRGLQLKEELEFQALREPPPVDDFGRTRRESAFPGARTKAKALEGFGDAKPYGGLSQEQLRRLPPEVRAKVLKKERQRKWYKANKRSKSWTIPRSHVHFEALYIPYRQVLQEHEQRLQAEYQLAAAAAGVPMPPLSPLALHPRHGQGRQGRAGQKRQRGRKQLPAQVPGRQHLQQQHLQFAAQAGQLPASVAGAQLGYSPLAPHMPGVSAPLGSLGPALAAQPGLAGYPQVGAYAQAPYGAYQHVHAAAAQRGVRGTGAGRAQGGHVGVPGQPGLQGSVPLGGAYHPALAGGLGVDVGAGIGVGVGALAGGTAGAAAMQQLYPHYHPAQHLVAPGVMHAPGTVAAMATSAGGPAVLGGYPAGHPIYQQMAADPAFANQVFANPALGVPGPGGVPVGLEHFVPSAADGRPQLGRQSRLGKLQAELLLAYPPAAHPQVLFQNRKTTQRKPRATTRWGAEEMPEQPEGARGLQLLDGNELVEQDDIAAYDEQLRRDLMYIIHDRLERYDDIQKDEGVRMLNEVDDRVDGAKDELRQDIQKVIDVDLANLAAQQRQRQEELQAELTAEIAKVNTDLIDKFLEQKEWNEEALERVRLQAKAMLKIKSDLQLEQDRLTDVQAQLAGALRELRTEFAKVLDIVGSVLELEYLSQGLEFQDEVDRHKMSLWALAPEEKKSTKKKSKGGEERQSPESTKTKRAPTLDTGASLELDEDCLSCCLEKYRPMIKAAFKMACIAYKPSGVPFNGVHYERQTLINLKRQMIEDLVNKQLSQTEYFYALNRAISTIGGTQTTLKAGAGSEGDPAESSHVQDAEHEQDDAEEPARPPQQTFKDNLRRRLQQLEEQVRDEDHVAARRLDLDIKECILDKALKEQIIRNQPVANLAMLFDMLGQQGDTVPFERYKETLKAEEDRLKYDDGLFKPEPSLQGSDDVRRRVMLDMRSSAYLKEKRASGTPGEDPAGFASRGPSRSQVPASREGRDVGKLIESIQEEREPEMDDLREHGPGKSYNLGSIQRHDSGGTDLKEQHETRDPNTQSKVKHSAARPDRVLNADLQKQLEIHDDFMRRAALSPQVGSGHGQIDPEGNLSEDLRKMSVPSTIDPGRSRTKGFRFEPASQMFTPLTRPHDGNAVQKEGGQALLSRDLEQKFGRLSKLNLRNKKEWSVQPSTFLPTHAQRSLSQLNMPNININDNFMQNRSQAAIAQLSAIESTKNIVGDTSPQSTDFYDNKMPAPHRRKGLLSSLNFISGKSGRAFPPTLDTPLHASTGRMGRSADREKPHDKSSTLVSTVQSIHAASPLKASHTTKADARTVREALLQLSTTKKGELLEQMKQGNKAIKNLDNLAVITGIANDKMRERVGEVGQVKEIAMAQISALTAKQAKGHGTGYLFSRHLVESLKSPHSGKNQVLPDVGTRGGRSPDAGSLLEQRLDLEAAAERKSGEVRALGAFDRFRNIEATKLTEKQSKKSRQKQPLHVLDSNSHNSTLRHCSEQNRALDGQVVLAGQKRESCPTLTKTPSTGTREREKAASPAPIREPKSNVAKSKGPKKHTDRLSEFLDQTIRQTNRKGDARDSLHGHVRQGQAVKDRLQSSGTLAPAKSPNASGTPSRVAVSFLAKVSDMADQMKHKSRASPFAPSVLHEDVGPHISDASSEPGSRPGAMKLHLTHTSSLVARPAAALNDEDGSMLSTTQAPYMTKDDE